VAAQGAVIRLGCVGAIAGAAMVQGVQHGTDVAPYAYLKVIAATKHFTGYQIEQNR